METTPVKSPVSYKRRRPGRALSELQWNASDVDVDPESAVSLLASDNEGIENVTPVKKKGNNWSDQPLSKRQTRSSTASGGDSTTFKDRAVSVLGTIFGKKGKEKGKAVERTPTKGKENVKGKGIERTPRKDREKEKGKIVGRTPTKGKENVKGKDFERTPTPRKQASKKSPVGVEPGLWHSPIEFVMEKRAMFAEIDAFELESEEEEPEEKKTTGKEMESDSTGETISLESSKGETSAEPPNTRLEQSTQDVTSTEEVAKGETLVHPPNKGLEQSTQGVTSTEDASEGETSVQPPNSRPEISSQEVTNTEKISMEERAVQTPTTWVEQSTEEVTVAVDVEEKDDG